MLCKLVKCVRKGVQERNEIVKEGSGHIFRGKVRR